MKSSKLQQSLRTDIYSFDAYYNWRTTPDVEDNNFKPLVYKIINNNHSCFITGPGGSGKTELIKQLQSVIIGNGKKYESVAPTNLSALLIGGTTIHRFASKIKKQSVIKKLDINYIFVDEVSLMAEIFISSL